jgi:peptidoglycan-N-acetylglucosamine deacetylase
MNRRGFTKGVLVGGTALALRSSNVSAAEKPPEIAITMDDFFWDKSLRLDPDQRNQAILGALKSQGNLKAALFVKGKNADSEKGMALLREWDQSGHLIGNHSYSHTYLNSSKVEVGAYTADIAKCDDILKVLPHYRKIYRFPYLKEGDTAAKRDGVRAFLKEQGYSIGHVTIDASDWAIEDRLSARLTKEPNADIQPYRDFYLGHMWEHAQYYDGLAHKVLGRSVKHTVLVHYNLLNALFLGDLLNMFVNKGWKLIDAADAFTDRVFQAMPKIVPAGESLIWALAKQSGKFDKLLRYPGEDVTYEKPAMDKLGL